MIDPIRRSDLSKSPDDIRRDLFGDDPQPPHGWTPRDLTSADLAEMDATSCHVPDFVFARSGIAEHFVREHYPNITIIKPYDPREDQ